MIILGSIRKVRINSKWYLSEINRETENLLNKLNIKIAANSNSLAIPNILRKI